MFLVDLEEVISDIKRHEGYRSRVYDDTRGIPTIGIGFAVKDLELDEDDCERILSKKIAKMVPEVDAKFPFLKDQPNTAKVVVLNMVYQMGLVGVSKFKLFLKALENEDYTEAASQMLDSRWSRQTPNRAKELSEKIGSLADIPLA